MAVVLDNIRSVHNVGSIFRTADALGVEEIFCCGITPGPLDRFRKVRADFAKVALGAERTVAWEIAGKTEEAVAHLRRDGWKVYAVEQSENSVRYYRARPAEKIALVLGSEVGGLSEAVLGQCDAALEIPMEGKKESLNVAVAFGIVAFDLRYRVVELGDAAA